jgi:hypothetical protein
MKTFGVISTFIKYTDTYDIINVNILYIYVLVLSVIEDV